MTSPIQKIKVFLKNVKENLEQNKSSKKFDFFNLENFENQRKSSQTIDYLLKRLNYKEDVWSVLLENNMIHFVDGKESFLPEIENHLTYGHTTGLMHPIIGDSTNKLIYMADLIPMAAHIPLPWVMAYDIHPVQTVKEKGEILPRIVDEEWFIFYNHQTCI